MALLVFLLERVLEAFVDAFLPVVFLFPTILILSIGF